MNLADKTVYPSKYKIDEQDKTVVKIQTGITYKEALVLALASNPAPILLNAEILLEHANAIIREMQKK